MNPSSIDSLLSYRASGPGSLLARPFQQGVRAGLQPGHLAVPGRLGRLERGDRRRRPPPGLAPCVQAAVGGDPVQPGPQRGPAFETGQAAPGREQGLLHHVLGILNRAEHPVAVNLQLAPVWLGELAEGLPIAGPGPGHGLLAHGLILTFAGRRPVRLRPRGCHNPQTSIRRAAGSADMTPADDRRRRGECDDRAVRPRHRHRLPGRVGRAGFRNGGRLPGRGLHLRRTDRPLPIGPRIPHRIPGICRPAGWNLVPGRRIRRPTAGPAAL